MNKNHIMYKLFLAFEQNNIKYLHFKSNTNLSDSFNGKGDFDVLVDKLEIVKIEDLILAHNGKRHNPTTVGNYVGVDNWLIFDENTGIIHHLHLHYQLVTGKQFVKDYVIPWNDLLFSSRVKDPAYGIYITNPNVELLLLAFRSVLKAKFFDYIKKILGIYHMDSSMQKEWNDLIGKASPSELNYYTKLVCPDNVEKMMSIVSKIFPTTHDYLWLHNTVRKLMRQYRRYGSFVASMKTLSYQLYYKFSRYWNRLTGCMAITKKISLQGGLIIAFVGVDGAGKSTVSNEITKWVGKKIECKRFYMGAGDGRYLFFGRLFKHHKKGESRNNNHKSEIQLENGHKDLALIRNPLSFIYRYFRACEMSIIQKSNYKLIQKMFRYRNNGGICILDRWPQIEKFNVNDGPKMEKFCNPIGNTWIVRYLLNKERKYLGVVKTIKPDLIFRLNISLPACLERKEEHVNKEYFSNKLKELGELHFQEAHIIEVDAEQPYQEEILCIKRILWKYI